MTYDKEAILKGLKGGLCDNYYGICCAVKYNMKDNDIIAALKELQKDSICIWVCPMLNSLLLH